MGIIMGIIAGMILVPILLIIQMILKILMPIYIPVAIFISMKVCKFEAKSLSYHVAYLLLMFVTVFILYLISQAFFPYQTLNPDGTKSGSGIFFVDILDGNWFLFTLGFTILLSMVYKYFIYQESVKKIVLSSMLSIVMIATPIIVIFVLAFEAFKRIFESIF